MRSWHVLIVDDEPETGRAIAKGLQAFLRPEERPRTTRVAGTPEEGLRALHATPPADRLVVICDDDLKARMDGVAFLEKVHAARPDACGILFFGGHVPARALARVDGAFQKPMLLRDLVRGVARVEREAPRRTVERQRMEIAPEPARRPQEDAFARRLREML